MKSLFDTELSQEAIREGQEIADKAWEESSKQIEKMDAVIDDEHHAMMNGPRIRQAMPYLFKEEVAVIRGGCPCLYTTPCRPDCSCVNPVMSCGCSRCCTYGSLEQRTAMAQHLAKLIDV